MEDVGDIITDFKLGASGDVLKIGDLLFGFGDPADPFGDGYVKFEVDGKNTVVRVDRDGKDGDEGFITLVTLNNVRLTVADTANYDLEPSPI